ncbi:MAG: WalW protein, partial [Planctomycetota bacterium]
MEAAVRELPLYGSVAPSSRVRVPASARPILLVVSDTEEEFDWGKPHDREATSVTAMAAIGRAQAVFDEYGVRPCYVIDYPVVSQAEGYEPLVAIHRDGRCEIGAHLHPWVSPPHDEEVCG